MEKTKTVPEGETQERYDFQICPKCKQQCPSTNNFCTACGTMLRNVYYCRLRGEWLAECGRPDHPCWCENKAKAIREAPSFRR